MRAQPEKKRQKKGEREEEEEEEEGGERNICSVPERWRNAIKP